MKKKGRQLPNMGLAALSIKIFFPAGEFICHILSFFAILSKKKGWQRGGDRAPNEGSSAQTRQYNIGLSTGRYEFMVLV